MSTLKKVIFLNSEDRSNGMGALTIEQKNNNLFAMLKTYHSKLNGEYVLGLKFDDRIIKQNVNIVNNQYNFIISDKVDLMSTIGCVLLKYDGTQIQPLIWGSEKNQNHKSKIVKSLKESLSKLNTIESMRKKETIRPESSYDTQDNSASTYEEVSNNNIHLNNINPNNQFNASHSQANHSNYMNVGCESYEEYQDKIESLSQISLEEENINHEEIAIASNVSALFESSENEVKEIIDNELKYIESGNHKFYDMISEQLEELFGRYPRESNLSKLIDNSSWVKISSDNDNKYYVVGIIKSNDDIKYICYGVPGVYNQEPPMEMRNYSQWLPVDVRDPFSQGYWVMYQDANTGENIFLN